MCVSGEEVLDELTCYRAETEEILIAMETRMGDRGIHAADGVRNEDLVFCRNPNFE